MRMKRLNTKQMAMDAMLVALCAVLGYISIDMGFIKVSFEGLPILLGGLLFGPVDGMVIGAMGTLIYQLMRYGLTATTLLWIIPYVVLGLAAGRFALRRKFRLSRKQIMFISILSGLMVSVMNTGVLFVDSKIYGYYSLIYVFGALVLRLIVTTVICLAYGLLIPSVVRAVRRGLRLRVDLPE